MKKKIRNILFFCSILCVVADITGCHQREIKNNEQFIADKDGILIICENLEDEGYTATIRNIGGDYRDVRTTIDELKHMDSSPFVENALGVAYLRLRDFDKAKEILTQALEDAEIEEHKSCVQSNMGILSYYQGEILSAKSNFKMALEKNTEESQRKLAIQVNDLWIETLMENDNTHIKQVAKLKQIIKKEKKILNVNETIGMYAYQVLAFACSSDGEYKKSEEYLKKAQKINEDLYQDALFEAFVYQKKSISYSTQFQFDEALSAINRCIELLEENEDKNSSDILSACRTRGDVYSNMDEYQLAIQDYERVLKGMHGSKSTNASLYWNLGVAYEDTEDYKQAIDAFAKAYCIWPDSDQDGLWDIWSEMRSLYGNYENAGEDFESWFKHKIQTVSEELDENGFIKS